MTTDKTSHLHAHSHGPGRGHHHDQGFRAVLRYLRLLPLMWHSDLNEAVVEALTLREGEHGVDLGAGAGAASVAAARKGARVLAVDPMPFMRTVLGLRRRLSQERGTLTVKPGAAEAIPASDASIDALWSVNTLHHWTDTTGAARELARVLKPGGRVLLLDEEAHGSHAPRRSGLVFDEVDPEKLASQLKSAGFSHAEGARTDFAGRPVKLVRATR